MRLALVEPEADNFKSLICVSKHGHKRKIIVEEGAVFTPQISTLLHSFYVLGAVIDGAVNVTLSVIWLGRMHAIRGVAVPLLGGPDLLLPFGTLENS